MPVDVSHDYLIYQVSNKHKLQVLPGVSKSPCKSIRVTHHENNCKISSYSKSWQTEKYIARQVDVTIISHDIELKKTNQVKLLP